MLGMPHSYFDISTLSVYNLVMFEEGIERIKNFNDRVWNLIREDGLTAIDAVIHLSNIEKIEPDYAAGIIDADIKELIRKEAHRLNLLKVESSLF